MTRPRFRHAAPADLVTRRGATTHRVGPDQARRLANAENALQSSIGVDTDELNLYRALGSSLLAYNFDPGILFNTSDHVLSLTTGTVYFMAVYLPVPTTVTGVGFYVQTAGVGTWSATGNRVGLYSSAGTRLAMSGSDSTYFTSTGFKQRAFTATLNADRGLYYIAIMNSRSATTTTPGIAGRAGFATSTQNLLTAAAFPRCVQAADTDLSASYTFSSGTLNSGQRWACLY